MIEKDLYSKLIPDRQTGSQDELGAVIYTNPTAQDMRFTEPTQSEPARGVEDPGEIIVRPSGAGFAAATKAERARRNP
ncbi:hypothetical protein HY857_02600 [Candidatus Saccharibacteria bacterium]|nr:hypothetical protein [Candidatus Saccharibacteria bacterium]